MGLDRVVIGRDLSAKKYQASWMSGLGKRIKTVKRVGSMKVIIQIG